MSTPVWREPPSVELLQWLARGALKQKLSQAVRLWVWLHFLYGEISESFSLPNPFTYADWREAFFSSTHTPGEKKPTRHDPNCRCVKTNAAWLFGSNLNLTQSEWLAYEADPQYLQQVQQQLKEFEQSLQEHNVLPNKIQELLHTTCPFGLTRRALAADLQVLVDLHCLKFHNHQYYRVSELPNLPLKSAITSADSRLITYNLEFLTQPDLAAIADNLSQRLGGHQRFFVHVEYVIPRSQLDQVDERQEELRSLWQKAPIPPIQLTYWNASHRTTLQAVVYPVCIYYYKRGPYLCGFGQIPQGEFDEINWRNYRLDRIGHLTPLSWEDKRVPPSLKTRYKTNTLPIPDEIEMRMSSVWGFDYYQPEELLLVRFDQEWDERYIRHTQRHTTFEPVDYSQVGQLIQQTTKGEPQKLLLKLWRKRPCDDAYYQAKYRQGDPNVMQRLRAWRPNIEIILPWSLRQQAAAEVEQERRLYYDCSEIDSLNATI